MLQSDSRISRLVIADPVIASSASCGLRQLTLGGTGMWQKDFPHEAWTIGKWNWFSWSIILSQDHFLGGGFKYFVFSSRTLGK